MRTTLAPAVLPCRDVEPAAGKRNKGGVSVMWDEGEDGDAPDDFLSESRMYVVFANGGSGRRAFGPYRTVQVTGDGVWASEGVGPLRVASKGPGGSWEIPNGSDQPATFRHVLVLCPPSGVTATQIEERLGPRAAE